MSSASTTSSDSEDEHHTIDKIIGIGRITYRESDPPTTRRKPALRSLFSRLWRATLTYLAITIAFPLTLILLLEVHFALRACLTTVVGLAFYSIYAVLHYGIVPPLPILTSIFSVYIRTASLGGTRFALMFAPSSLVAGVGAAIMHALGYLPFKPSHILSHLTVVDFRTPSRTGYVSLTSVLCDIGVGSVFLLLGLCSFFGLQDGVGRGTGVVAEHPWVALAVGMIGSSAVSTYHAVRDAAKYADAVAGDSGTNSRESMPEEILRERRMPRSKMSAMKTITFLSPAHIHSTSET
ncbi:hypothetical protein BC629DRAFT_686827 [Irpex lacteus]|nr:hypothetical protein BC629DRAFT_686827 [Irpex lacteus]